MKKWILLIWLFCVQLLAVHAENEYYTIFVSIRRNAPFTL